MRAVKKHFLGYLFLSPYAAAYLMFVALPFVVSLCLAFSQYDLTAHRPAQFVGFRNFKEAWNDPYFWDALRVTIRYVIWIIPTQIVLSVVLGVGLNAMTRGRNLARALLFLPGMFSIAVTAIIWQYFYNQEFGLFNFVLEKLGLSRIAFLSYQELHIAGHVFKLNLAMPSIVFMTLWWTVGGSAAVILTGLQQIPSSIHEAAAIDGASPWQSFWKITLPMLKPVLSFMVVMNTIGAFQMFAQAALLTGGGPERSTRGMVSLIYDTAFAEYRLGYGAAISWMLFVLIVVFSQIQSRILKRFTD